MKNYEDDGDLFKIPNLGKHYSLKWTAVDDSWEGKSKDAKGSEKKRGLSAANSVSDKLRNGKRHANDKCVCSDSGVRKQIANRRSLAHCRSEIEKGGFGALTQRLISW